VEDFEPRFFALFSRGGAFFVLSGETTPEISPELSCIPLPHECLNALYFPQQGIHHFLCEDSRHPPGANRASFRTTLLLFLTYFKESLFFFGVPHACRMNPLLDYFFPPPAPTLFLSELFTGGLTDEVCVPPQALCVRFRLHMGDP